MTTQEKNFACLPVKPDTVLLLKGSGIKRCDKFAITVEFFGWPGLVGSKNPLVRLAPAWMCNLRIDVRPKAVFPRLDFFPKAHRLLVGEADPGLTIARVLAELHEGTLTLESRKGHGTIARVRLPLFVAGNMPLESDEAKAAPLPWKTGT